MGESWIFPELIRMRNTMERMISYSVENAKNNQLWDGVADDLIDAKRKIIAAIKVKEGSCA